VNQTPFEQPATFFFWKGRVALYGILKALGIGPGDDVVVPGFTCVVVPQAVRFAGARPIYVDIGEETLNLDPNQLGSVLTSNTKAVIVQHTFGLAADMDAIRTITDPRGIRIIEDCAHSMGTLYHGEMAGTLGDAAFFSTQWSKPITTGLGGIAVTRDPEIAKGLGAFEQECISPSYRERWPLYTQLKIYRMFFQPSRYWKAQDLLHALAERGLFIGSSSSQELDGNKPEGYEKRMAPFQIRHVRAALARLQAVCNHRRYVARAYAETLKLTGLKTAAALKGTEPVILRYPVMVADKQRTLEAARKCQVEIGDWFVSPLHPLTGQLTRVGYRPGECPVGERVSQHVVNLPTHLRVDDKTIGRACEFLRGVA
jgi:perosamine synthetase